MDVPFDDLWDSGGATLDKTLPVMLKGAPHGSYVILASTSRARSNEKDGVGGGVWLAALRGRLFSFACRRAHQCKNSELDIPPPHPCAIAWSRCSFTITMLGFTPPVVGPAAGAAAGGKL